MIGISLRELSRRLVLDKGHLSRLAAAGRIPRHPDNSYDEEAVRAALKRTIDPARRRTRREPSSRKPTGEAVGWVADILRTEGLTAPSIGYDEAKVAETILKVRELALRLEQRRARLLPLDAVQRHVGRAYEGFREAFRAMPARFAPVMAEELGVDPQALRKALDAVMAGMLDEMRPPAVPG